MQFEDESLEGPAYVEGGCLALFAVLLGGALMVLAIMSLFCWVIRL